MLLHLVDDDDYGMALIQLLKNKIKNWFDCTLWSLVIASCPSNTYTITNRALVLQYLSQSVNYLNTIRPLSIVLIPSM